MGIRVTFDGNQTLEASGYSVSESSSPLAAGDTSGGTGSFSLTFPRATKSDGVVFRAGSLRETISKFTPAVLVGKSVTLGDNRRGRTFGVVTGFSESESSRTFTLTCRGNLSRLDVYNIQSQPFSGTLGNAFRYYVSLAKGVSAGSVFIDPDLESKSVRFPGWNGDLWFHLKQMAMTADADISLVSGLIVLRPIRTRVATRNRETDLTRDLQAGTLAQFVEVYQYNNTAITNQLVYPPGGWTPEVQVLNVNAGETSEYTLQLSSSLSSFQQPVMDTVVTQNEDSRSVYTVVANDGLPVSPALWSSRGGRVEISLNPDTTSLTVRLTGATGIPLATGGAATSFALALASDTSGNRYSTLRLVGSGVRFDKQKIRLATGIPATRTGTEVGATVDNPFVSTHAEAMRIGMRLANEYSGPKAKLSGTVIGVNRASDEGTSRATIYAAVQAVHEGKTYATVQTEYAAMTYAGVQDLWTAADEDSFDNQTFGNVNGARYFDDISRRWYRIREATVNRDTISISAEDDLTMGDARTFYTGKTYAAVQTILSGMAYELIERVGLYG